MVGNYQIKDDQAAGLAALGAGIETGSSKINDLCDALSLANDVIELFGLKQVLDDRAGVQVVLL